MVFKKQTNNILLLSWQKEYEPIYIPHSYSYAVVEWLKSVILSYFQSVFSSIKKGWKPLMYTMWYTSSARCYRWCRCASIHLEVSRVHADVDVLVGLAAVLQVVEGLDLVQGVQQAPGEQADPQHTGRVHAELEAV